MRKIMVGETAHFFVQTKRRVQYRAGGKLLARPVASYEIKIETGIYSVQTESESRTLKPISSLFKDGKFVLGFADGTTEKIIQSSFQEHAADVETNYRQRAIFEGERYKPECGKDHVDPKHTGHTLSGNVVSWNGKKEVLTPHEKLVIEKCEELADIDGSYITFAEVLNQCELDGKSENPAHIFRKDCTRRHFKIRDLFFEKQTGEEKMFRYFPATKT